MDSVTERKRRGIEKFGEDRKKRGNKKSRRKGTKLEERKREDSRLH